MPVYVYRCPSDHEVEEIRPIGERDDPMPCVKCDEAGAGIVEMKRITTAAVGKVIGGTPTFHPGRAHK